MITQRANAYRVSAGNVYYIEQYDQGTGQWITVGDTYTKLDHVETIVNHHNRIELLIQLGE